MIEIKLEFDKVKKLNIDEIWIKKICKKIFLDNKNNEGYITFIISTDAKLNKLKKDFFDEDVFTDTISFNLEEDGDPIEGEVYISLDRIYENSIKYGVDNLIEIKRIIIHSCLHLLGYDDKSIIERDIMTDLEEKYLSIDFNILST